MADKDIFEEILEDLDQNGRLSDKEWRRRQVVLFAELGRRTKPIAEIVKKVERLESNSVLLIARKHPKAAVTIAGFFILLTFIWIDHLKLWYWFFEVFGLPTP